MKRFTETTKWKDKWFRSLPVPYKLFWLYLCDECDAAGYWEHDMDLASFMVGASLDLQEALRLFEGRIEVLDSQYWLIKKFIAFQYGHLNPANPCHRGVLRILDERGYQGPYKVHKGKGTEKEKEKEKEGGPGETTPKVIPPPTDAVQRVIARVGGWFNRRPTTQADAKEIKAAKAVLERHPTAEEVELLEEFYTAKIEPSQPDYRRRDVVTLLNNWNGEIDRAKRWKSNGKQQTHTHQGNGKPNPRNVGIATDPVEQGKILTEVAARRAQAVQQPMATQVATAGLPSPENSSNG